MARTYALLLTACSLLFPVASAADTPEEIRAALDYYAEMWNEDDIEAITGYYHQDFVLITPQGPVPYAQRIQDLREVLGDDKDQGALSFADVTVRVLGDKHALAYGRISMEFKDGSSLVNWFSTTYVKTPFGWKALQTYN